MSAFIIVVGAVAAVGALLTIFINGEEQEAAKHDV